MKLSQNTDFFEKKGTTFHGNSDTIQENPNNVTEPPEIQEEPSPFSQNPYQHNHKSDAKVSAMIKNITESLQNMGFDKLASQVQDIKKDLQRERFVVSVVGEFNHGKSTFLNRLLDDAAKLPVGTLPTTAIMTRIRYSSQPKMAVFDETGNRKALLEIREESWKDLVANNFGGEEPKGHVVVGVKSPWLGKYNLELVDCPGAGDLSSEREKVIGDVLNRTDGAIIALNATATLSQSERLFIKNRILGRKVPFTLGIINKLDLIKKEERPQIIKFIKDILMLNKMDIPVFVPYPVEMPDDTYKDIIGIDKVLDTIVGWINDPERHNFIQTWVKYRIIEVTQMALDILKSQLQLASLEESKRVQTVLEKKQKITSLELEWNDLAILLQKKANECYNKFLLKVEECSREIVEKLQYEAAHASNPEKWWKEDYPYRLKVELANMSIALENLTSRIIANDAKWFNDLLHQKFDASVMLQIGTIADKEDYKNNTSEKNIEFENLGKKHNIARVGTVALSLALAPVLGLVATMGVGTAGTLIASTFFKRKIEDQRQSLKEAIAKDVPHIIMQATSESERRIQNIYDDLIRESDKKKDAWLEAQSKTIDSSISSGNNPQLFSIQENINSLNQIINNL